MNEKKYYLNIDEQIELLKKRKLNIKEIGKLEHYLQKYSYQDFVNGYNDFFIFKWR